MKGEINQLVPYERILNHCCRYPEIPLGLGNTLEPPGVTGGLVNGGQDPRTPMGHPMGVWFEILMV